MQVYISFSDCKPDQDAYVRLNTHICPLQQMLALDGDTVEILDRSQLKGGDSPDILMDWLNQADVILLLLSPDFLASKQCRTEMDTAQQRQQAGEALVIRILIRPAHWSLLPVGGLLALPRNHKPISTWGNKDLAWFDVIAGLLEALSGLLVRGKIQEAPSGRPVTGLIRQVRRDLVARWNPPPRWLYRIAVGLCMAGLAGAAGWYATRCEFAGPACMVPLPGGTLTIDRSQSRQVPPFLLDRTEVSVADYERFTRTCGARLAGRRLPPQGDTRKNDFPVVHVTYEDAEHYCRCRGARLPTEEEWISAASTGPRQGRGNLPTPGVPKQIQPVNGGPVDVTPEGLLHLAGNVREWVDGESAEGPPPAHRVMGGSYVSALPDQEASPQFGSFAGDHADDIGFRCARSVGGPS